MDNAGSSWTDASGVRLPGSIVLPSHWWILIKARHGFFFVISMLTGSSDSFREDLCCFSGCSKPHFCTVQDQISILLLMPQGTGITFLWSCLMFFFMAALKMPVIKLSSVTLYIPFNTFIKHLDKGSRAPLVTLTRHKVGWDCWPAWGQEGSAEGSGEACYLLKFFRQRHCPLTVVTLCRAWHLKYLKISHMVLYLKNTLITNTLETMKARFDVGTIITLHW